MVSSTALLTRMPDSEKESLFSAGVGGGEMSESELHVKENNCCLILEMTFMSLLCAGDLRRRGAICGTWTCVNPVKCGWFLFFF